MLEVEDNTKEPGTVVQEIQKGYMMKDRLLRPSLGGCHKKSEKKKKLKRSKKNSKKRGKKMIFLTCSKQKNTHIKQKEVNFYE